MESIWRVIIATFTFVQAPYAVHTDMAGGDAAMRDTARFHFGFTVPLHAHPDARATVAAVAAAEGDLGILPVSADPDAEPWWPLLAPEAAPKIIARLPFVERHDHPADLPVFVIARPTAAAAVRDEVLFLIRAGDQVAGETVAEAQGSRVVAVPGEAAARFAASTGAVEIGSHAARYAHAPTRTDALFPRA